MKLNPEKVYIINLDKDVDRYKSCLEEYKKLNRIDTPVRISGVYGKYMTEKELSENTSFVYSKIGLKSAIGCAMSHIKTWQHIVDNNISSALILEDDAMIDKNFASELKTIDIPSDYNIVYLGCTIGCDINKEYSAEYSIVKAVFGYSKKVIKINDKVFVPSLPLALHGYILSYEGAKRLLENVKRDKIHSHIDAQILKYIYTMPSYSVSPQLIYQKDIDIATSNNINSQFPSLLNNLLTYKDSNGIPINYKMNIGYYQICGYTVNGITGIFIALGIILGLYTGIKIKSLIVAFIAFITLEAVLNIKEMKSTVRDGSISFGITLLIASILR